MDAPRVLWAVRRRPHGRMLAWATFLGFACALGSTALLRCLTVGDDPLLAGAIGAGLGLFLVASLCQGSSVRVESGGRLVYALRGHDMVAVDVRQVTGIRQVGTGALDGIAVACPLDALTFLSRKGVSRRQCEACLAHLGAPLVLEFLLSEDAPPLWQAMRTSIGS